MASRYPDDLTCPNCGEICHSPTQFDSHYALHRRHIPMQCDICGITCNNEIDLRAHKLKRHKASQVRECDICGSTCNNEIDLRIHKLKRHKASQVRECDICGIGCRTEKSLHAHKLKRHKGPQVHECDVCGSTCNNEIDLRAHKLKRHKEPRPQKRCVQTKKGVTCRKCGASYDTWRDFYAHRHLHHPQHGGQMRTSPFEEHNIRPPWENEDGEVVDIPLRDIYNQHRRVILEAHNISQIRIINTFNFPLSTEVRVETLMNQIHEVYQLQESAFRLNLSFGFILRNIVSGELRYFYPHNNESVWDNPFFISSRRDFLKLRRSFHGMDLETVIGQQRPNTKWRVVLVTNVRYVVTRTNFPLGSGSVKLPNYIKSSKCIITMDYDKQTKSNYSDNLCFFRCLAYHRRNRNQNQGLERDTKELFEIWCDSQNLSAVNFEGIDPQDLPELERLFNTNIEVLCLREDGSVLSIHRSCCRHRDDEDTMYLNIYNNHLSYISNINGYSSKFQCDKCQKLFKTSTSLKRHMRVCEKISEPVFPGGYFKPPQNVFEELDVHGIHVPTSDRYYPFFATFDFESVLTKIREEEQMATDKLTWMSNHEPISVSISSNIPGFTKPKTIVNPDQDELLEGMFTYLKEISSRARELSLVTWGYVFTALDGLLNKWKPQNGSHNDDDDDDDDDTTSMEVDEEEGPSVAFLKKMSKPNVFHEFQVNLMQDKWDIPYNEYSDDDDDVDDDLDDIDKDLDEENDEQEGESEDMKADDKVKCRMFKALLRLKKKFELYTNQLIVAGFNSAKYDLPLVKAKLAKHMGLAESLSSFTVKKNNSYMCITSDDFRFIDISQFLSPGMSYSSFLKAYQVHETKGFFPYEWLDHANRLQEKQLPSIDAFHSSLKNINTLEEEWQVFTKLIQTGKSQKEVLKEMRLNEIPKTREENYAYLHQVWASHNMETMKDFLIWYNERDVQPMVLAIERMQAFYFNNKKIDIFKDCISVPGIARRLLFRCAVEEHAHFSLIPKEHVDLFMKIKRGIVGGPSIIYTRKHKVGETFIRSNPDKPCGITIGYDSNALYLLGLSMDMPTGGYIRRQEENGFKAIKSDRFFSMFDWMEWQMAITPGLYIHHKENFGKEVRVGPYYLDGYDAATKTAYEYNGCYYHAHDCATYLGPTHDAAKKLQEKRREDTAARRSYLQQEGYTIQEIYECQFKAEKKSNPTLRRFIQNRQPTFTRKNGMGAVSVSSILDGVRSGDFFGMVECDISVPSTWDSKDLENKAHGLTPYQYFEEFSPLFATTDVPFESFGQHMQDYVQQTKASTKSRRLLIGGMKGSHLLLATPLLSWYLSHGLVVTKVYEAIEYTPKSCFKSFTEQVTTDRREGDAMLANVAKLIGNSSYGSLLIDKTRHSDIVYVSGQHDACLKVNDPRYRSLTELDDDQYEVNMSKKRIEMNMPIQLGYFILQYAKLRMLQFYYDCIDYFCDRSDFEYIEMDTDSAYLALSRPKLIDIVKPELRESFLGQLENHCQDKDMHASNYWFPRTCCEKHAQYDSRQPGLFKVEFSGNEMICLCSKTYVISNATEIKLSCKGIQKRRVDEPLHIFNEVLNTQQTQCKTNMGFRSKDNKISTYSQVRGGFSYFYVKRQVQSDGIHTKPLDITLCPPLVPLQ